MSLKLASIDFEYNRSKERNLNLVCCALKLSTGERLRYWLHANNKSEISGLKAAVDKLKEEGYTFLAYAVTAEARSFLSLHLNPLDYRWIDLYVEYRQILNHNHELMYGKQLKDGKKVFTKPPIPKWKRTEEDEKDADFSKPEYGLAAACYKLLNVLIDTKFKKATRDLIISDPEEFTSEEKQQILDYCAEDVEHLEPLFYAIVKHNEKLYGHYFDKKRLLKDMIVRSRFSCRTAIMEREGYPINLKRVQNFSTQVPSIILSCQREIRKLFSENPPFYKFKRKEGIYTLHQEAVRVEIRNWLKEHPRNRWMLTDGGKSGKKDLSLSLKAFQRHFNYTHTYPKDNFFAQMVRYLKLKQNLNGFLPGGKSSFWDYVGSDGQVRAYFGIYGAQSSRNQPKATGFIPLKSAWMRVMIEPPKGYAIASIDYKSQEFLIAALLSKDIKMIEDYQTGDVYLAFGKSIDYIPKDGTKAKYKQKRDECKPIVLGIQFDMTKFGLAKDLTEKWGRKVDEEEAQKYIDGHEKAYKTLWRWKKEVVEDYRHKKFIRLPDGWTMFGDNDNFRSVGNVPVQGLGACVMRKAIENAQDTGLVPIYPLHDAIYIIAPIGEIRDHLLRLATEMDRAFRFFFPKASNKDATVGLEADIWSPEIPKNKLGEFNWDYKLSCGGTNKMEVKVQDYYIDPRGKDEYEYFKQYLEDPNSRDYFNMEF